MVMKGFAWFMASVLFGMLIVLAVSCLTGCQVDVSGAVGGKVFYPDKTGKDKDLGDPRKGMYDGSGYVEKASTQSDFKGFGGMKGGAQ
jgi:hypothetical protein